MKSYKLFLDQITEAAKKKKPDFLDIDKDGDTKESMEDAADDKEKDKKDDKDDDKKDK